MRFLGTRTTTAAVCAMMLATASAQMIDNTQATSTANAGINKSLSDEIGARRGNLLTTNSSIYIINRDPFRSIRRGRQLFQRKFTQAQGQGPNEGDGSGDINTNLAIGAGLSDSCASCHGRPRGSGGVGGNVVTRPDSRDAGHLFGLGLKEMLADEITTDLRSTRDLAIAQAQQRKKSVTLKLLSKGVRYGSITANPDGSVDTSQVAGLDPDLRVKPFFAEGSTISIREFVVGALHKEMGMEASSDPDLLTASAGGRVVTPSGLVLDGSKDKISPRLRPMRRTETKSTPRWSIISNSTCSTTSSRRTTSKTQLLITDVRYSIELAAPLVTLLI